MLIREEESGGIRSIDYYDTEVKKVLLKYFHWDKKSFGLKVKCLTSKTFHLLICKRRQKLFSLFFFRVP